MITTLLLSSWLATGQAPAPAPMPMPMPPAGLKALPMSVPAPVSIPMPMTVATPAPVVGMPIQSPAPVVAVPAPMYNSAPVYSPAPQWTNAPAPSASAPAAAPAAEEPAKEETKYLAEKLLEGTPFGQRLADRGVKIYGWSNFSYTASSTSRFNNPITFNDHANAFQLNQNWFEVAKSIDTSKKEVQYGYKASILFAGTDYRFTLPRGLLQYQVEDAHQVGWDPVYHYGEVFLPNLGGEGTTVRVGRWGTSVGYEVIDAVNTPFLSKSYVFQWNPFTHTGVQATTQLSEELSVYNGVVTGSDVYIDPAARATYVGGLKYTPKEGKGSIGINTVIGTARFLARENFTHFNSYNIVLTRNVSDKLTYVLDATYSHADKFEPNANNGFRGGSANWYGVANYFLYKVNDKLSSNFRVELFDDAQGVRTGFKGLYTAATYGLTYTPKDWMLIRPFVRYDYNSRSRPFEGDKDIFTGGVEAIVRW
jgi:hypothetical protein